MFLLIAFTFLITSAHQGTYSYEECKTSDFKAMSCVNAKALNDANEALLKLQK